MKIFFALILAHLLTDFTFQTNRLASWKRASIWGIAVHSAVFLFWALLLTYPSYRSPWRFFLFISLPGWLVVILLTVLHYIEDYWRIVAIKRNSSEDNCLFFLIDQWVHFLTIFILFPYGEGPVLLAGWFQIFLIGAVLVTDFTTILLYYLGKEWNYPVDLRGKVHYRASLLRLLAFIFIVYSPQIAVSLLSFAVVLVWWQRRKLAINFPGWLLMANLAIVLISGLAVYSLLKI